MSSSVCIIIVGVVSLLGIFIAILFDFSMTISFFFIFDIHSIGYFLVLIIKYLNGSKNPMAISPKIKKKIL